MTARRYQGTIVEWNDEKHCGFIQPRGTTDGVVFLRRSSIKGRRTPKVGDVILYESATLEDSRENRRLRTRVRAENACYLGEEPRQGTNDYRPPTALAAAFLLILLTASLFVREALWLMGWSLAFSLLSLVEYAKDKAAAQKGSWRTPEGGLHLTALLGGWPGAALAQALFRHKTQKREFQTIFIATVVLNVAATIATAIWLATSR